MSELLLIKNASQLVTTKGYSNQPAKREKMSDLRVIENGSVLIKDGTIQAVGMLEDIEKDHAELVAQSKVIDATGKLVTPGLIDPHTHLVHAGTRENEYAMRLKGKTYMEIMNAGGGIHATTEATKEASFDQLYDESLKRLDTLFEYGVTTVVAKSCVLF